MAAALPVAGVAAATSVDATIGTGMVIATAVTATAPADCCDPAGSVAVFVFVLEELSILGALSVLEGLSVLERLSVIEGLSVLEAESALPCVPLVSAGFGLSLPVGELAFWRASDRLSARGGWLSFVADRASAGGGAGGSGSCGAGRLLLPEDAALLSTRAAKLSGPERRSSLDDFDRGSSDTLAAVSDVTLNTGGLSRWIRRSMSKDRATPPI